MPSLIPPVLHPLAVHAPIILIPAAAALATYAAWKRPAWATMMILIVLGLAAAGAFASDQLGDRDFEKARDTMTPEARAVAHTHSDLGSATWLSTVGLFAIAVLFRKRIFASRSMMLLLALALWALFALITVTAWYGGALTYEYGVNAS